MRASQALVLLVGLTYGWGAPGLKGARPAAIDAPLAAFHNDVNLLVAGGASWKDLSFLRIARGAGGPVGF